MELFFLVFVLGVVVTPIVAASKGRNWAGWLVLGILLPIIALLLVALMPSLKEQVVKVEGVAAPPPGDAGRDAPSVDAQRRPCPHCAEPIMKAALKCRFCGEAVEVMKEPVVAPAPKPVETSMATTPCYRCAKPVPAIAMDCPSCGVFIRSKKQAAANAANAASAGA